jgi:hypothetical protein
MMSTCVPLGPALSLDVEQLVATRLLIQAQSGAGKSWALRRILEQTHGMVQQLVIDPEGEFASLREKFDYVLVAKTGGDAVADPKLAKKLAIRLLELNVSAVLDISELHPRDRIDFVRQFLDALMNSPRKLWHPALVVLDESSAFCPQKGEAASASAVIDLCVRGRKRGFAALMATQRISRLNKDAAAELTNKLIGRTSLDVDMARAAEELGMSSREDRMSLRMLEAGQFYAFGPALTNAVTRVMIGSVKTTHPKAGARIGRVAPPPTATIAKLLPQIADLAKEEAAERLEVDALRDQVRDLRRQVAARPAPVTAVLAGIAPAEIQKVAQRARGLLGAAMSETLGSLAASMRASLLEAEKAFAAGSRARDEELAAMFARLLDGAAITPPEPASPGRAMPVTRKVAVRSPEQEGPLFLSRPEQQVLDACAWLETFGVERPTKPQVAAVAGYRSTSGGYRNLLSLLKTGGLIEYPSSGAVELTDAGRAGANYPENATGEALRDRALGVLNEPERRVLRPLLEAHPNALGREELARLAEYEPTSGGFRNLLSSLRTIGFVDYPSRGTVIAQSILFPEEGA